MFIKYLGEKTGMDKSDAEKSNRKMWKQLIVNTNHSKRKHLQNLFSHFKYRCVYTCIVYYTLHSVCQMNGLDKLMQSHIISSWHFFRVRFKQIDLFLWMLNARRSIAQFDWMLGNGFGQSNISVWRIWWLITCHKSM